MNERGKSDGPVVPAKPPNKPEQSGAEVVEGRGPVKGNTASETRAGHRAGQRASSDLERVRRVAQQDRDGRLTALLHHVTVERLAVSFRALRPGAAAGVDGVTWREYELDLAGNLRDLHARVHSGTFRAKPSRRSYIAKADGGLRPLGIAALEDKIVQRAVVEVLNAIYETDFLGFSYGFRPGRKPHDALDALASGLMRKKVNWVLDADIRDYFGSLDQAWLVRFLVHRVLENGSWTLPEAGVPQGATVSPLLANVYLHYVFDLWAHACVRTRNGRFRIGRVTEKKRMRAKRRSVRAEMRRRMHLPIREQGAWLRSVFTGHLNYYGVPGNSEAIGTFRYQLVRDWWRVLRRRSQRSRLSWTRMSRIVAQWLPPPRIKHPWPNTRFDARTQDRSPVR